MSGKLREGCVGAPFKRHKQVRGLHIVFGQWKLSRFEHIRYPVKAFFWKFHLDASLLTCPEKLRWFPAYSLPILLGVLFLSCSPKKNGVSSFLCFFESRLCRPLARFGGTSAQGREERSNAKKPDTFDLQFSIGTASKTHKGREVIGPEISRSAKTSRSSRLK